jgi:hypothetical protein
MRRPTSDEYPAHFQNYMNMVRGEDIIKSLKDQVIDVQATIAEIPEEKESFAYADGKWTIKQVIGHIIDTERILGYRAMRFARKDKTALSGFDENFFVDHALFNKQTLYALGHEFAIVREANLALFKTFDEEAYSQVGNANGHDVSVRSILFMIAGHATHHLNVIKLKYLLD